MIISTCVKLRRHMFSNYAFAGIKDRKETLCCLVHVLCARVLYAAVLYAIVLYVAVLYVAGLYVQCTYKVNFDAW
jgi:hypothetical protein